MVKLVPSGFALGLIQLVVDFCNEVRCLLCKSAKSMINKLGQSMTKQDTICCASGTAAVSAATLACYIYWAIKCASDIFRPSKTRIDLIRKICKNSRSGRTSLRPCHLTKIIKDRWPHDTCTWGSEHEDLPWSSRLGFIKAQAVAQNKVPIRINQQKIWTYRSTNQQK